MAGRELDPFSTIILSTTTQPPLPIFRNAQERKGGYVIVIVFKL